MAVLSAGVRRGKPTHRVFFEAVDRDPFRLRADVEVGGAVYRPYGTFVRTRLLVVDRTSGGEPDERVVSVVESVGEAVEALRPLRVTGGTR
ncbi:MAG TPA: hypothetical protein RMG95_16055 [Polyangiaceae bacterium LLY-WYZ-15_(1-7)]|nr:hypothetical protein [Polyangiaceae bacterium LLY-WYZ-15_(1-7)]